MYNILLTVSTGRAILLHELDASHPHRPPLCVYSPSRHSSKFFLCLPAVAGHSCTISALCCKVRVRNSFLCRTCALFHFPYPVTPVFATHTKTAGCVPTIPILELVAANFRHLDEDPVTASPLECVFTNCDACKSLECTFTKTAGCRWSL